MSKPITTSVGLLHDRCPASHDNKLPDSCSLYAKLLLYYYKPTFRLV